MKRLLILSFFMVAFAFDGFAANRYDESEFSGWLMFMSIIMFAWGILEIILFFKIWGMTNDIRALKMDHFNESNNNTNDKILQDLRKNLILGNIDNVKKTLLKNFIDEVRFSFFQLPNNGYEKDEKGKWQLVGYKEKNLQKSILPYVENLQKQFNKIGEELPSYIKRMETYGDYFNLFVEEDFVVKKEEKVEEKKN